MSKKKWAIICISYRLKIGFNFGTLDFHIISFIKCASIYIGVPNTEVVSYSYINFDTYTEKIAYRFFSDIFWPTVSKNKVQLSGMEKNCDRFRVESISNNSTSIPSGLDKPTRSFFPISKCNCSAKMMLRSEDAKMIKKFLKRI